MIKKNSLIKLIINLTLIIIVTAIIVSFFNVRSEAASSVQIRLQPNPKIDIVTSKIKSTTDISNFKQDILNALARKGIDTTQVNVEDLKTEITNLQDSFSWRQDLNTSIGSITLTNNGQNVKMVGNQSLPGKNALWIVPEVDQEQEFNLGYNIDFGDSFKAAGMLLRIKEYSSYLEGYALSFNKQGQDEYSTSGNNGALWKVKYNKGTNTSSLSSDGGLTLVAGLNISTSGTLNVKVSDTKIQITANSGNSLSSPYVYNIPSGQEYGCGYGFFSDHYSHNCDQWGSFQLTNINLTTVNVKKATEILRAPNWRNGSIRVLVNISDKTNPDYDDQSQSGEIKYRLINENINLACWGNSSNQSQFNKLISDDNGNGIFINNTSYSSSVESTASYIKTLVDKMSQNSQYAILDEPIKLLADPPEILNNTKDTNWPNGKWKVVHDYKYFENDLGQYSKSNVYLSDMMQSFDKTGKYTITYEDKDTIPNTIYVHRRPVAQIKCIRSGNNVTLQSASYDLDKKSVNNGISEEEWKYKKTSDSNWSNGKLTKLDGTSDYIVQLRVKDFQDTWSYYKSLYLTNTANTPPIASFTIEDDVISKYEQLNISDESYDPSGGTITSRTWTVYKDGSSTPMYTGSSPLTKYDSIGTYKMQLVVKNSKGISSQAFSSTFTITEDTEAPEFIANPQNCEWKSEQDVTISITDKGGSGVQGYKYAITDSQTTPATWSSLIKKANDTIKINQEGKKYLHVITYDNAGNASKERVLGLYKTDTHKPTISVTPEYCGWTSKQDVLVSIVDVGPSGFYGYKYAITDSKDDPSNWSDTIFKSQDTITLDTDGEKYIHLIACDNARNVSDKYTFGPYKIDTKAPTISVTPENCDWKYSQDVDIKISDEGQSGIVGYKYAITDSEDTPTSWSDLIEKSNDKITIKDNGQKYFHIFSYDNANNVSSNYTFGLYKIDNLKPVIKYEIDSKNKVIDTLEMKLNVTDEPSGIKKLTLNGQNVENGSIKFNKNGKYTIYAEDIVGNNETETIDVTNIYYHCNAGLGHPDYSSSLDGCPICKLLGFDDDKDDNNTTGDDGNFDKMHVTETTKTYNATPQGIEYENPKDAVLITYYDKSTEKPTNAGKYAYDIKVVYEGNEYNTGINGMFEIKPKKISLQGIEAKNKKYDGNDIIELSKGELVGIEGKDKVSFSLPPIGKADSKNAGIKDVKIDEIELRGSKSKNYELIQPKKDDVKVEISPLDINIKDLSAMDKEYDGNNKVKIQRGTLEGILNGDTVSAKIPEEGQADDKNAGKHKVHIEKIKLEGKDAKNYNLIQPEYGSITMKISQKPISIVGLEAQDKTYDGNNIVKLVGGKIEGKVGNDDVSFLVPDTVVSEGSKVGIHRVIIKGIKLEGHDANNYKLEKVNDVTVKISEDPTTKKEIIIPDKELPKTGVSFAIVIMIFILFILSTIIRKKYKNINKQMKKRNQNEQN